MKLKAILDTLDGLDEALKGFYTEKDGKFFLQVDGYDPGEVEVLRSTMRRAKDEKKAAERELADLKEKYAGLPDDFSVDDYNATLDKNGGKIDQRLAEQRERLTKQYDTKLTEANIKLEAATKRADRLYIDNAMMGAMAEAGFTLPQAQKAIKSMFRDQVKVEYEGDDVIVTIENMTVLDKLKAYAQSDEGKFFVSAPNNGGGGSGGGQGSGTADYSKMNDTQLMLAQDKDPRAKAEMERRTKIDKPVGVR